MAAMVSCEADDHQFFQPMYIANLGPISKDQPFDEENTGWGWKTTGKIDTQDTILPTSCKINGLEPQL